MRRHFALLLAGTMLLGACEFPGLGPTTRKQPTKVTAKPSESPAPAESTAASPSTAPSTPGSTAPSQAPASVAPSASATPSVPLTTLSGLVKVDAHYVIQTGGGNFVSTNGGTFVATNGGTVIATGGGNVIATGGGNVISVGGGNVISVGGGNVISVGGGNFRVLADVPAEVAIGAQLPIKGMGVIPVSLTTRLPIGEPVLTNEKGEYTLQVPEAYKDNYLVYAVVPGKDANDPVLQDPRLRYNVVVTPEKAEKTVQALDEDSSLASQFVLRCFVARCKNIMIANDAELDAITTLVLDDWDAPDSLRFAIELLVKDLNASARAAGITKTTPNVDAIAQAVLRTTIAHMDNLYDLNVDYSKASASGDTGPWPEESAFGAMADILKLMREKTAANRQADPSYYGALPFIIEANKGLPADQQYVLKRPSDLCDFIVSEYLSKNDSEGFFRTEKAFKVLMPDDLPRAEKESSRMRAAAVTILAEIGKVLTTNAEAKAAVAATMKSANQAP